MCLLIGSPGVGKTLLLKRLNNCSNRGNYSDVGDPPATQPTVGTNLMNVVTKKGEITVRELGGCMAPIWKNYFKDANSVMFMVDLSNRLQVSASCVQLLDVLTNDALQTAPVLLLYNKSDIPGAMKRAELESIMRMPEVLRYAQQRVSLVECSAHDGHGLQEIARWIQDHGQTSGSMDS